MYHLLRHEKNLHVADEVYLCALYDCHNKQQLFPETAVVFVIAAQCAFSE
jgi:hypothetical protein